MTLDAHLLGATGDGTELIRLTGVEGRGFHGCYDHERRDGQRFVVDVTLHLRREEHVDELETTVDYGDLAAQIVAEIEAPPANLIETLASHIADVCLTPAPVRGVVVTVHKPEAPMPVPVADASVTLVRVRP